jgi:putative ABC transport system ATP-binding protein
MLILDNVTKLYKLDRTDVCALNGVTIEFRSGEMVALVGPSGSGKSTLLHLAGLIDQPTSGRIVFRGRAIEGANDAEKTALRQQSFGFIFQSYHLLPTLTAAENVALPMLLAGVKSRDAAERAAALMAEVGLEALTKRNVRALSGGQRQRVAIARALINDPEVLFADEPTANLDAASGELVRRLLFGLCDKKGIALVLATHDHAAAALAHRVVRIADGRKAEESLRRRSTR